MANNPLIDPFNYFEGYKESVEKLKNNPELISFDKVCYELFENTEMGKKFIEMVTERYLMPSLANLNNPNYTIACVYGEGFKDAYRLLINSVRSHAQRIKAETNPNDGK